MAFAASADLACARAFYEQVLGLPVAGQDDFACVFNANGTTLRGNRGPGGPATSRP